MGCPVQSVTEKGVNSVPCKRSQQCDMANGVNSLSLQKGLIVCHCKRILFITAKGVNSLLLQKGLIACYCKRGLQSVTANGVNSLSLQKGSIAFHCKRSQQPVTAKTVNSLSLQRSKYVTRALQVYKLVLCEMKVCEVNFKCTPAIFMGCPVKLSKT